VPTVVIAPALARWLNPAPGINVGEKSLAVSGGSVRDVLESVFREYPVLRGYVFDERGAMRHHVVAFLNGAAISDKTSLSDAVDPDGELYLFQALSGG